MKTKDPRRSKKAIRNRLDREVGEIVRGRGRCERCSKTTNLQCCHIYSRRYSRLRHNELNLLCLCAGCHFWAHQNPVDFTLFVQGHLGEDKFRELIDMKNNREKFIGRGR